MLSDASRKLSTALNGKAYYKQVTVVVPTSWRNVKCNQEIHMPRSGSSYGVSVRFFKTDHQNSLRLYFYSSVEPIYLYIN